MEALSATAAASAAALTAEAEQAGDLEAKSNMPLSSALAGLLSLRNDSSWRKDAPASASTAAGEAPSTQKQRSGKRSAGPSALENDSDSGVSTDGSSSTTPEAALAAGAGKQQQQQQQQQSTAHAYAELPKEVAYMPHPMTMVAPQYHVPQHLLPMHPTMVHYESLAHIAPAARKRAAEPSTTRDSEPQMVRGRYYAGPQARDAHYDMYPPMQHAHMARYLAAAQAGLPMMMAPPSSTATPEQSRFNVAAAAAAAASAAAAATGSAADPDSDGLESPPGQDLGDDNSDARLQNLQKLPVQVVQTLDAKLQTFPGWDSRITSTKLGLLGGEVLPDSSPLLGEGERAESVTGYDPKKFHILCTKCGKHFTGKNAPRTFELHAIFWELYSAHPSFSRLQADREHRAMYPCNSVSRDVVVFMEAKRPCLCNNQKKIWRLQGNLHHDVSLFQGRGWIQAAADGSANVPDKTSLESVLCCRAGKLLEQYDTLRMHVYTWHDSGVFTPCASCRRVYQNTRAYLSHGCMRKGSDEEERVLAQCAQHMTTLLDTSPEFAMWFFKMRKLSSARRDEVFDRVSKRLRITSS